MNTEERLCADLVAAMEQGLCPSWRKPWKAEQAQHRNPVSGAVYSGAKPIVLELAMALRGSGLPLWSGFGQAKARGLHPRKGSKAALILRPEIHKREEVDENGEKIEFVWTTYKAANVFNFSDLEGEGLTALIDANLGEVTSRPELERLESAEAVLNDWEVMPQFGGSKAFYMPATDVICLPSRNRFESPAAFVATWAHEVEHSTGHKSRLNRDLSGRMGSASYARGKWWPSSPASSSATVLRSIPALRITEPICSHGLMFSVRVRRSSSRSWPRAEGPPI